MTQSCLTQRVQLQFQLKTFEMKSNLIIALAVLTAFTNGVPLPSMLGGIGIYCIFKKLNTRQGTKFSLVTQKPEQQPTLAYRRLNSGPTLDWEQHVVQPVGLLLARPSIQPRLV